MKALLIASVLSILSPGLLYCQQIDGTQGIVVSMDGTPIPGAKVNATPEDATDGGRAAVVTLTDNSGHYRFDDLPSGDYLITAGIDGQSGSSLRAILGTSISFFDDIVFISAFGNAASSQTRGNTRTVVDVTLLGPARVTVPGPNSDLTIAIAKSLVSVGGRVSVMPEMTLPSPMRVTISPQATLPSPAKMALIGTFVRATSSAVVQSDGYFELRNVPPGSYVLRLEPNMGIPPLTIDVADRNIAGIQLGDPANGVRVSGNIPKSDRPSDAAPFPQWVYLVGRDIVDMLAPPSPLLETRVRTSTDLPSLVQHTYIWSSVPQEMGIDEAGEQFELPMAPVGTDGKFEYLTIPSGTYSVRTIPKTAMANTTITIRGADVANIQAGVGVRVRGEVIPTNQGTRPPEVIRLTEIGIDGAYASASINENGAFEFPNVGPGKYRVLLDGRTRPAPSEITVEDTDTIIRVEASYSSWIRGRLQFAGVNPPTEIVTAVRVAMDNGYESQVSSDGSFRIPSNDGEYDFFVKDLPDGFMVKSVLYGSENVVNSPVKVDASTPAREILVTLEYRPGATP